MARAELTIVYMDGEHRIYLLGEDENYISWRPTPTEVVIIPNTEYKGDRIVIPKCNIRFYEVAVCVNERGPSLPFPARRRKQERPCSEPSTG